MPTISKVSLPAHNSLDGSIRGSVCGLNPTSKGCRESTAWPFSSIVRKKHNSSDVRVRRLPTTWSIYWNRSMSSANAIPVTASRASARMMYEPTECSAYSLGRLSRVPSMSWCFATMAAGGCRGARASVSPSISRATGSFRPRAPTLSAKAY